MTYNTKNAVPSVDVRDLYDNAQNLDNLVNGPATAYPDRLGVSRKSYKGMELDFAAFLAASGFELPALAYVDGSPLTVDRPTQLIEREGILYSVKAAESFPATLTGIFATDQERLVVRTDQDLRQDLANVIDPSKGAGLVGHKGRTLSEVLSDEVNVKDFGAKGDGVTDDTAAIQAALNFAFSNSRSVRIEGGSFKCSQILLPQNSAEPTKPFYIYGENATIDLVGTNHLFTVDGDFFYDLFVSGLFFLGEASGNFAAVDSKIFDCGKIMRLNVSNCSSLYVNKFFDAPAGTYAQSVYAHQCIYRRGNAAGFFFVAPVAFDVSLVDCLVEQSYNGLRVVAPSGVGNLQQVSRVTIRGGAWESLFGTAIGVGPCFQFTVDSVYFEGNGTDINLSFNPGEAPHLGVTITSNDFYQSAADITDGKYNVIWGSNSSRSYRTGGNKSNGRLHDTTGALGHFDFTGDSAEIQLFSGMNSQNVRVGNSPVGRADFATKEASWFFDGNNCVAVLPAIGALELGRIGNADLVNGKVVRPRVAFGSVIPSSDTGLSQLEWCIGSYVHNSVPSEIGAPGAKYIVVGWACTSSGFAGSSVWKECRALTGG